MPQAAQLLVQDVEPMVKVLTTEFTLTSQIFEVLSPEAESKWVLSGLQLIYSNKWCFGWSEYLPPRGKETWDTGAVSTAPCLSRDDSPGGGGTPGKDRMSIPAIGLCGPWHPIPGP